MWVSGGWSGSVLSGRSEAALKGEGTNGFACEIAFGNENRNRG
jgi:hypothetical protein